MIYNIMCFDKLVLTFALSGLNILNKPLQVVHPLASVKTFTGKNKQKTTSSLRQDVQYEQQDYWPEW